MSPEEPTATIRVRDDGAGMSKEFLPRVLDMFARADRTLDRSKGGLGLGLTLAYRIVQLHRGSLDANSPGLGRGSEFTVRLTSVQDRAGVAAAAHARAR